jgi:hypothetical protein
MDWDSSRTKSLPHGSHSDMSALDRSCLWMCWCRLFCWLGNMPFVLSLCRMHKLGLVDRQITSQLCGLATKLDLRCFIGTTSLQRGIAGGCHNSWAFQHCKVGGVTTWQIQGCCLVLGANPPQIQCLSHYVPYDASTMLCPMASAQKYRPTPSGGAVLPLGCENLQTTSKPYYHGQGLLPGNLDCQTEVLSPGVFAPKHHWALWNVTLEEVLVTKDF